MLLLSLISFSGYTVTSIPLQKTQTELVTSINSIWASAKENNYLKTTPLKVSLNHFTVFNFKFFLNNQLLDFNTSLKSQKNSTIKFLKHLFLKQNLIAKTTTFKYKIAS
ncbi:hypothetical protein [Algibacter sp. R77976]|uniref:hypothetical protein n=1 Tax=Algibacter sp. R77976 TaxID=3093873 RepID=UPI0037CB5DC9